MAAPNILNLSTVTGKTNVLSVSTTVTDVANNAAASGKVVKINSLVISNINGSSSADVSAEVYRSATSYFITKVAAVPAKASLVVVSKETAIYLEEGDALRLTASANSYLQAVCSYEEMS